jgi:hypothetical protein
MGAKRESPVRARCTSAHQNDVDTIFL